MGVHGSEANVALLVGVAESLGHLRESLVFVGGCATAVLVTAARAQPVRVTMDVDLVAEVATLSEYNQLERQFEALGFVHDLEDIITVVDGRDTLHEEVVTGPAALGGRRVSYRAPVVAPRCCRRSRTRGLASAGSLLRAPVRFLGRLAPCDRG